MQVQFPSTNVIRHVDSTSIEGRRALEGQTNVLAAERAIGPIPNHLPPSQVVEGTLQKHASCINSRTSAPVKMTTVERDWSML